jgi:hypothetical protein
MPLAPALTLLSPGSPPLWRRSEESVPTHINDADGLAALGLEEPIERASVFVVLHLREESERIKLGEVAGTKGVGGV